MQVNSILLHPLSTFIIEELDRDLPDFINFGFHPRDLMNLLSFDEPPYMFYMLHQTIRTIDSYSYNARDISKIMSSPRGRDNLLLLHSHYPIFKLLSLDSGHLVQILGCEKGYDRLVYLTQFHKLLSLAAIRGDDLSAFLENLSEECLLHDLITELSKLYIASHEKIFPALARELFYSYYAKIYRVVLTNKRHECNRNNEQLNIEHLTNIQLLTEDFSIESINELTASFLSSSKNNMAEDKSCSYEHSPHFFNRPTIKESNVDKENYFKKAMK